MPTLRKRNGPPDNRSGGRIDVAKEMAGHGDERTTGLYDRSTDKMTKEEVERGIRHSSGISSTADSRHSDN